MRLTIGSHHLENNDGIVNVRGTPQITLEWGHLDSVLLVTMNLYEARGAPIARLRRNAWTFNDRDRFEFTGTSTGFHLVDTKRSQIVLRARVVGQDAVTITHGVFFSSAGDEVDVTSEDWGSPAPVAQEGRESARLTNPHFSAEAAVEISHALMSGDSATCPNCGCPLTLERFEGTPEGDRCLVSCMICRRNLVIMPGNAVQR